MNAILQVGSGALLGDFLTAVFHWFEDVYLPYSSENGILGQISRDNEMHHFLPYTITASTPFENISVTLPFTIVFLTLIYIAFPKWSLTHMPFLGALGFITIFSNLVHRYVHERPCKQPVIIKILQDAGILISTSEHAQHHTHPDRNYGVVLGFTNSFYDGIGLWRRLEYLIPLQKYPKPGVDAYKPVYDSWTKTNMEKECPDNITPENMKRYEDLLQIIHQNHSTNNTYPSKSAR